MQISFLFKLLALVFAAANGLKTFRPVPMLRTHIQVKLFQNDYTTTVSSILLPIVSIVYIGRELSGIKSMVESQGKELQSQGKELQSQGKDLSDLKVRFDTAGFAVVLVGIVFSLLANAAKVLEFVQQGK
jgi:hypothetical protein